MALSFNRTCVWSRNRIRSLRRSIARSLGRSLGRLITWRFHVSVTQLGRRVGLLLKITCPTLSLDRLVARWLCHSPRPPVRPPVRPPAHSPARSSERPDKIKNTILLKKCSKLISFCFWQETNTTRQLKTVFFVEYRQQIFNEIPDGFTRAAAWKIGAPPSVSDARSFSLSSASLLGPSRSFAVAPIVQSFVLVFNRSIVRFAWWSLHFRSLCFFFCISIFFYSFFRQF